MDAELPTHASLERLPLLLLMFSSSSPDACSSFSVLAFPAAAALGFAVILVVLGAKKLVRERCCDLGMMGKAGSNDFNKVARHLTMQNREFAVVVYREIDPENAPQQGNHP